MDDPRWRWWLDKLLTRYASLATWRVAQTACVEWRDACDVRRWHRCARLRRAIVRLERARDRAADDHMLPPPFERLADALPSTCAEWRAQRRVATIYTVMLQRRDAGANSRLCSLSVAFDEGGADERRFSIEQSEYVIPPHLGAALESAVAKTLNADFAHDPQWGNNGDVRALCDTWMTLTRRRDGKRAYCIFTRCAYPFYAPFAHFYCRCTHLCMTRVMLKTLDERLASAGYRVHSIWTSTSSMALPSSLSWRACMRRRLAPATHAAKSLAAYERYLQKLWQRRTQT